MRGLAEARIDIAHAIIIRVVLLGIRLVLVAGLAAEGGVTGGSLHALFVRSVFGSKWHARVQLMPVELWYWTQLSGLILPKPFLFLGRRRQAHRPRDVQRQIKIEIRRQRRGRT